MNEAPKKALELTPLPTLVTGVELPKPVETFIHTESYQKGFREGFAAADVSGSNLLLFGCGSVALLLACIMVMRHASRLMKMLCAAKDANFYAAGSKKLLSVIAPLILCVSLAGCAGKREAGEPVPPVPVPPQTAQALEQARPGEKKADAKPDSRKEAEKMSSPDTSYGASYVEDGTAQYLAVDIPADLAAGPHKGEPDELAGLLELRGVSSKENTAVTLMRPAAIREAAQLVTFQTAIAWRYKQLVVATENHGAIMDTAFDFSPLVMTQGDALIMPPLLTRAGASMRIEKSETATAAETTYELLEPARYIATVPNWREFLMVDGFPEPEKPNPAVLPKNVAERAVWRAAVREAWAQGLAEADQLYADNVASMVRNYRGVMLYHLLTAQHLLSRVETASADLGMHSTDNKLNIGQKVYRITAPSAFTAREAELRYAMPPKVAKTRKSGR